MGRTGGGHGAGGGSGGLDPTVIGAYLGGQVTLREAVGIDDDGVYALRSLGHGYLENGRYDDARVVLEGLSEIDDGHAWTHAALGAVYQSLDLTGDALAAYDRALAIDPDDVAARVNRGELRLAHGAPDEGIDDLAHAVERDPAAVDPQANRARALLLATREVLESAVGG